jgi:hypothetical protein
MESYYHCPCGHGLARHGVHLASGDRGCLDCECWTYHGHRVGNEPHTVVQEGMVEATDEMRDPLVAELAALLARVADRATRRVGV